MFKNKKSKVDLFYDIALQKRVYLVNSYSPSLRDLAKLR